MKGGHKKHKHTYVSEEHSHKKCRRKKDRSYDRSRSSSRDRRRSVSHERSRSASHDRSRSVSRNRSRSRSYERTKSKSYKRSVSRSPDERQKKETSRAKPVKSRKHDHRRRADDHHIDNALDVKVKIEPLSDDEASRKRSGKSNKFQKLPESKWEKEDIDSKPFQRERGGGDQQRWGKKGDDQKDKKPLENKAKPDFGLSGKLAEEVNTFKGVVIKYSEPPEARMPKRRWRLYPFKGETALPTLYIHRQSAYLIGRDRIVADFPVDHPSCSKQHAVLQYRVVPYTRENGSKGNRIRPYIIDLDSANGTYVNNNKIETRKYVELLEKDVIKFGYSSREYVLLHEHSKDEEEDDDVIINDP